MKLNALSITAALGLSLSLFAASNVALAQTKLANAVAVNQTSQTANSQVALAAFNDDDKFVPDANTQTSHDYKCELNGAFTFYTYKNDDSRAGIRWKNKLYGLKRIATTTGANRFENKKAGLVWIGIPTKSMLMDSHHGEQLANECKTANQ